MTRKDRMLQNFLVGLFGITAFVTIAIFSLTWVNGLSYDKATGSFEKTSVIAIESDIKDVSVFINDDFVSESLPVQQRNLTPGNYDIEVRKNSFHTLKRKIDLRAGQVEIINDVVMVANKPLTTLLVDGYGFIDVGNFSTGLSLIDGKLYDDTDFITRFSKDPEKIYRFNFTYLYLVNNEIRIFIPATNQDFLVLSTSQTDVVINTKPFSWSFALLDGDSTYLVNVSESSEALEGSSQ